MSQNYVMFSSTGKTFKTREDFSSEWDYGEYVYNTVTQGMTVRMRCDHEGLKTGEMAVVVEKWGFGVGYSHWLTLQRNNSDVTHEVWCYIVDIIG